MANGGAAAATLRSSHSPPGPPHAQYGESLRPLSSVSCLVGGKRRVQVGPGIIALAHTRPQPGPTYGASPMLPTDRRGTYLCRRDRRVHRARSVTDPGNIVIGGAPDLSDPGLACISKDHVPQSLQSQGSERGPGWQSSPSATWAL